jgi:hypothetical protein
MVASAGTNTCSHTRRRPISGGDANAVGYSVAVGTTPQAWRVGRYGSAREGDGGATYDQRIVRSSRLPLLHERFPALRDALPHLSWIGPGYGHPTPEARAATALAGDREGLGLDPVYTAKAFAALLSENAAGRFGDRPALYLHTDGPR